MVTTKRPPGRPKTVPAGSKRINIQLSPAQIEKAKEIGTGLNDGIRKAIDAYAQRTE